MSFVSYARIVGALTVREMKHWYRNRMQILMTIVQPLVWLGLFGLSVAPFMLFISRDAGPDYFSFLSIGMIVVTALTSSMTSGMSIIWDRRFGFLEKLRAAPIPRGAIPLSRVIAATIKAVMQALMVLVVALILGLKLYDFTLGDLGIMLFAVICVALIFSSIFVALGLAIKSFDTYMTLNTLLNMPLMFVSGAMFPADKFPSVLKAVADANPITYATDAIRRTSLDGWNGMISIPQVGLDGDLIVLSLLAVVSVVLGILFARSALKHE
jgi:ABC-2 type transport system permease protein